MHNDNIKIADLHAHTNESDGLLTPRSLVEKAADAGLSALAITDHDTVNAYIPARDIAERLKIEIIPAIELSAATQDEEIHILGYFVDTEHELLGAYLEKLVQSRLVRAEAIVRNLNRCGCTITFESVQLCAKNGVIARPHIAEAMVNMGFVSSYQEAFDFWIGDGRPACVQKHVESYNDVIKLVHDVVGVAVLAHPGPNFSPNLLKSLVASGLDGIEILHPRHNQSTQHHLRRMAQEYNLITTGGSDYHGGRKINEILGSHTVPYSIVEKLYAVHIERKNLQN